MGISAGPKITTDGLVLHIDATNNKSYSGSGITIFNMVTGGIAGTLVNGSQSDVAYKKTFLLDGTNDTIQMQLPSGIVTGSPITVSLWAKWKSVGTSTTTIQTLVDNQYQVADNIGFFIQDRPDLGSVLEWSTQPNLTVNRRVYSTQVVGDGGWHHIVGTNDGTYSRLYVDGYETGTAKTSAGIATTQDMLSIGNWAYVYSSPRYLNGSVSNFKVYNRALSATEILTDYFSTKNRFFPNENIVRNGLILNLDPGNSRSYSGTGNTIYDLAGTGNSGNLTNGPTFSSTNGGALVFDGVNDSVKINNIMFGTLYSKATSYSCELWMYINNTQNYTANGDNDIVENGGGNYPFVIRYERPLLRTAVYDGVNFPQSNFAFTKDAWIHFALVVNYSDNTAYNYLNGVLVSTFSVAAITNTFTSTDFYLFSRSGTNNWTTGKLGPLHMYNRALSATEVIQNFNAMRERYNI